jgi:Protein of unknown function (DUF3237)
MMGDTARASRFANDWGDTILITRMMTRTTLLTALLLTCGVPVSAQNAAAPVAGPQGPSAPAPELRYVFSIRAELLPPVEQGTIDGRRLRFIPISGGTVYGPRLQGSVLAGGGDWQAIGPDGLTEVNARYALKAADGTVIDIVNAGVRTASKDVIDRLAKGEDVDPALYYFRTSPRFTVAAGPHEWMRRSMFVARGIRKPDHVVVDFYLVE